jgi:adenosylmethionine-8-amino-7-oxononanoate aminotransferase
VHFVPPPKADESQQGPAAQALDALLAERGREIAAMVIEPLVQGATGMRFYPAWYLKLARERCDAHGALLIIDEVFTGYGRTGTFWASDQAGVSPDISCTAKAFSGGMFPMAATLVTDAVYEAFLGAPEKAFYYGHSFCGNPLGARVALEVLDIMRDEQIVEGVAPRSALIAKTFERLGALDGTVDARTLGMIGAIDLTAGASYLGQAGWRVFQEARRRRAYLRPLGDVVYITPPLNIAIAELEELLAIVEASVVAALQ